MTPAEIIARAQCFMIEGCSTCGSIEGCQLATGHGYYDNGVKIIAALAAAGLKIMGREPTEAMLDAARGIYDLARTPNSDWFRAMFDAAPPLDTGDGK